VTGALWPAEFKPLQESVFRALAKQVGGGRRLWVVPVSFRGFPETGARANEALRRAKRQPRTAFGRWLKHALLAGQYNWSRRYFTAHPGTLALAWNGLTGTRRVFLLGASDAGAARLHCELAPLAGYVTVDPMGVNAEGLALTAEVAGARDQALIEGLRGAMVARAPRRGDQSAAQPLPDDVAPFVFVPLQVPEDSQIRIFAGWVGDIPGFLAAIGRMVPHLPAGSQVRIKEHPSARTSFASEIAALLKDSGGVVVADTTSDTFDLVRRSQGVLTINSSVGFQAFLWDKPVIATGQSFWTRAELATLAHDQDALDAAVAHLPSAVTHQAQRHAFVTWLARDYLVPLGKDGPDAAALKRKIELARSLT
jgi:capsular polysaccharide export protein